MKPKLAVGSRMRLNGADPSSTWATCLGRIHEVTVRNHRYRLSDANTGLTMIAAGNLYVLHEDLIKHSKQYNLHWEIIND